jgi:hypothetical protein
MKKSAWFLWGTLVMVTAFGLTLAGCPTEGGDDGGDPAAAEQLAADINKMSAGSATVNGATVTLRGRLSLESPFTVPAGVTLDLTGDNAALELQDGAVLTVNGTVNALGHGDRGNGWVEGGLRIGDGGTVIAGSGTIQLKGKGRLLNVSRYEDGPNKTLTLDGVTLAGVADNNGPLVDVNNGGAFVMKSGKITANTNTGNEWTRGGGVRVEEGGAFTMQGGTISGNTAKGSSGGDGGGVDVEEGGTFTMQGGMISGNTATNGGGVNMAGGGTFTMQGGAISGNTTAQGQGGGVSVSRSSFIMEGGEISGNTAQGGDGWAAGGGVTVQGNSTFIMEGGAISGNTAESEGWAEGGGVYMAGSIFTMKDGVISGNTAQANGGGVVVRDDGSVFTMEGGTIYGKSAGAGLANSANHAYSALHVYPDPNAGTANWGTGGTYTKGGVEQTGGSEISGTDDTLIAIPAN